MTSLPDDYLERVYAGVLGKLVGVYIGRPFEGWTHQRILEELGAIHHYVHEKLDAPLVVTDDDVSGTFAFVRALEEHGTTANLSAKEIGKTWLNNVIEGRTIFWWGGRGISTEHTAFLNLKKGVPAPQSGSIRTNGKTVAEQIGAQIFIDGWAMVAPGNPSLAAQLAEAAGSVSHDGESVYAATLWAAMEAEAFVSKDLDHLIDVGLGYIPSNSLIARLIGDVRGWVKVDGDWKVTRQRIEDKYGYDKFCGFCHVVPNHGIMIMALLYAGHDFHQAIHIINTCGWDTDCNSGNVGCLVAIILGLDAFTGGPDWRGPLADRALISSADGGYTINNAVRIAYDITNLGRQLAKQPRLSPPKDGAQFHFSLPGGVQGFQVTGDHVDVPNVASLEQGIDDLNNPSLAIRLRGFTSGTGTLEVLTHTFLPLEVRKMVDPYEIGGSPLLYPGQRLRVLLRADQANTGSVTIGLRLKVYTPNDDFLNVDASAVTLEPDQTETLEYTIPDDYGSQPIQSVGLRLTKSDGTVDGTIWVDHLRWDGTPKLKLKADAAGSNEFWYRSFVNSADKFRINGRGLIVGQNRGEGLVAYGTREWKDYSVLVNEFTVNIGYPSGLVIRAQGLNRYYAAVFEDGKVSIIKALDEERIVLATQAFDWSLDTPYRVKLEARGGEIRSQIADIELKAHDEQYQGGGCGFVVTEGSIRADYLQIAPSNE